MAEHLVERSRAAGPDVQSILPYLVTLAAALQGDPRRPRLQCRSGLRSGPHYQSASLRLFLNGSRDSGSSCCEDMRGDE